MNFRGSNPRSRARSGEQRTRHASTPTQGAVETAQGTGANGSQTRRSVDEAGRRSPAIAFGLAIGENPIAHARKEIRVQTAQRQTAPSPPPRRPLSFTQQHARTNAQRTLGILSAVDPSRTGLQTPQRRPGHPADLPPKRDADRSSHFRGVPGLLRSCHVGTPAQRFSPRPHYSRGAGKDGGPANDRCAPANDRRSDRDFDPL